MDRTISTPVGSQSQSTISQSFRDQKQIEDYIRTNKLLKIIEDAAENFIGNYQKTKAPEEALAAVIVKLPFVYADFFDRFLDLLHLAVEEPLQFVENTKYSVYGLIRDFVKNSSTSNNLKVHLDIDQVHLQLRFIGLPLQPDLLFDPSSHSYHTGLCMVDGILRAHTEPENFVIQAVWYCGTGCVRNKIITESLQAPVCSSCSRQMNEYSKLRVSQKFCLLRIQLSVSVRTPRICDKIFQPITVKIKGKASDLLRSLLYCGLFKEPT